MGRVFHITAGRVARNLLASRPQVASPALRPLLSAFTSRWGSPPELKRRDLWTSVAAAASEGDQPEIVSSIEDLLVGDEIVGRVTNIRPFGAFVDIGIGKDGLVHISQLSYDFIERPEDCVSVGEEVRVRVMEVDTQRQQFSLSMKLGDAPPRQERFRSKEESLPEGLEENMIYEGTVTKVVPFGAFIDLGPGKEGLLHISEMSYDFVESPNDVVSVGDNVQVRVLQMDRQRNRLSLTMRLDGGGGGGGGGGRRRRDEFDDYDDGNFY